MEISITERKRCKLTKAEYKRRVKTDTYFQQYFLQTISASPCGPAIPLLYFCTSHTYLIKRESRGDQYNIGEANRKRIYLILQYFRHMLWPVAKALHQGADTLLILKTTYGKQGWQKATQICGFFLPPLEIFLSSSYLPRYTHHPF